jgi:hypothetical protein
MSEMPKGTIRRSKNGKWVARHATTGWTGVFPTEAQARAFLTEAPKDHKEPKAGDDVFGALAEQLAQLTTKMRELASLMEESRKVAPAHQQQPPALGTKVVDVRALNLYVEPVAYHEEVPAENAQTTDLRRQLREAEAWLESSDTWVERTRAEENIQTLRRELGYAEVDRPWTTHHNLIGVERQPYAERRFAPPSTPFTDRADAEARAEKFERRTGQ